MVRKIAVLALSFFVLGFVVPAAWADSNAWLTRTKDKGVRGIEDGLFGMGGELYHHISTRSEKNTAKGWTLGFWDGLNKGLERTLVGAYELTTPFYHDKPILSDLDTTVKP